MFLTSVGTPLIRSTGDGATGLSLKQASKAMVGKGRIRNAGRHPVWMALRPLFSETVNRRPAVR